MNLPLYEPPPIFTAKEIALSVILAAVLVLLFFGCGTAHAQCDTVAPSGKLLSRAHRSTLARPEFVLDTLTGGVRHVDPCAVVKKFGCPTCGSERRKMQSGGFENGSLARQSERSQFAIIDSASIRGGRPDAIPVSICSECGTVYAGRRRK